MKKRYLFDEAITRVGTDCVKWNTPFETSAEVIYPLWVADMDFACSDAIVEALHQRCDERAYGYNKGLTPTYRKAVCDWFAHRFAWNINPNTIFYAGGVVSAIAYLLEILSKEGDGIVIQTPVYHPFRKKIEASKRVVMENPLINTEGYYTMDYVQLEEQLKSNLVAGMILCSPHNPSGRVWKVEELRKVVDIAKKYNKWIISDEIHCDIIRKNIHHTPLLTIAKDYNEQIVVCTAPSKSFNLAGLQNSNIIIENLKYQQLWKDVIMNRLCIDGANSFAISATIAAYKESEEWLDQVNEYIDANMEYAKSYIEQHLPKAIVSPLEGTFLLWIDLRAYFDDFKALKKTMLAHGLIFNEGFIFGKAGAGFERINVACPRRLLKECLSIFVEAVRQENKVALG